MSDEEAREILMAALAGRAIKGEVKLRERFVLEKFEGDPPRYPGEKLPFERITIENGKIIERVTIKDGIETAMPLDDAVEPPSG